jgi:hypothetical protein
MLVVFSAERISRTPQTSMCSPLYLTNSPDAFTVIHAIYMLASITSGGGGITILIDVIPPLP